MNATADAFGDDSARQRRERLTTTLIFALLIHGILLLGIGFVAVIPAQTADTTLRLTLATTPAAQAPDQAGYRAPLNQRGPGNTRMRGTQTPDALDRPFMNAGALLANRFAVLFPDPVMAKLVASAPKPPPRSSAMVTTRAHSRSAAEAVASERPALLVGLSAPARLPAPNLTGVELPRLYGLHPVAGAHAVNARAAIYAPYLLAWQRRVEAIGTAQFTQLVPASIRSGHLTIAVALASDGRVRSISILEASRFPALDAAALKIIRLAAPFAPFPPELRAQTASLSFSYRWNFIRRDAGGGSLGLGGG